MKKNEKGKWINPKVSKSPERKKKKQKTPRKTTAKKQNSERAIKMDQ